VANTHSIRRRHWLRAVLLVLPLVIGGSGCSTLGYYAQSIGGELRLLSKREPIDGLLRDPRVSPHLKSRLAFVEAVRDFASDRLDLPDNDSYRSYVDIGRSYVVWAVVAAPEFSLEPRTWCFPMAGCVSYRGYFSERAARQYADGLREEGYDVHVGGVAAYSTLGWFDDPLPSSVVRWPDDRLAGLVFHELAHQRAYVRDDSAFNEAFAVTVAREGVRRWLQSRGAGAALDAYRRAERLEDEFLALVLSTRRELQRLYDSPLPEEEKRRRKAEILGQMHVHYESLRARWGGDGRYDKWFAEGLNNARLAAVGTYHDLVPGFQVLLAREGGSLGGFYKAVQRLGELPRDERRQALAQLAQSTKVAAKRTASGKSLLSRGRPANGPLLVQGRIREPVASITLGSHGIGMAVVTGVGPPAYRAREPSAWSGC
jgi:predicted aminopeptidase